MGVHQTGWTGQVVVPCSHCNSNDEGPEAGICHRGYWNKNDTLDDIACRKCLEAEYGEDMTFKEYIKERLSGMMTQISCRKCDGTGYRNLK